MKEGVIQNFSCWRQKQAKNPSQNIWYLFIKLSEEGLYNWFLSIFYVKTKFLFLEWNLVLGWSCYKTNSYKKIIASLLLMLSSVITQYIERKAFGPIINKQMIEVPQHTRTPTHTHAHMHLLHKTFLHRKEKFAYAWVILTCYFFFWRSM